MPTPRQRDLLIQTLPPMAAILRGSLLRYHHQDCPCHPKGRYGPYWRLSVNYGGRTRMYQLRPNQVPRVRQALKNYRRWWKTCLRIFELNTEIALSQEAP